MPTGATTGQIMGYNPDGSPIFSTNTTSSTSPYSGYEDLVKALAGQTYSTSVPTPVNPYEGDIASQIATLQSQIGSLPSTTQPVIPDITTDYGRGKLDSVMTQALAGQRNQLDDYVRRASLTGVQRGGYNVQGAPNYAAGLQREAINALASGYENRFNDALAYLNNLAQLQQSQYTSAQDILAKKQGLQQSAIGLGQSGLKNAQDYSLGLGNLADKGTERSWQGGQNDLNRALQLAMQQGTFGENALQRNWQSGENTAQRGWQTGENTSQRSWQGGQNALDRIQQLEVAKLNAKTQEELMRLQFEQQKLLDQLRAQLEAANGGGGGGGSSGGGGTSGGGGGSGSYGSGTPSTGTGSKGTGSGSPSGSGSGSGTGSGGGSGTGTGTGSGLGTSVPQNTSGQAIGSVVKMDYGSGDDKTSVYYRVGPNDTYFNASVAEYEAQKNKDLLDAFSNFDPYAPNNPDYWGVGGNQWSPTPSDWGDAWTRYDSIGTTDPNAYEWDATKSTWG